MASIIITLTTLIFYILLNKLFAHRNKNLKTSNSKLEHTKIQLLYGNLKNNIDVILNAFNLSSNEKINNNHYVDSLNNDIFFIFDKDLISNQDFYQLYRDSTSNTITIFCINANNILIPQNSHVTIIDLHKIHNQLAIKNLLLPSQITITKESKPSKKEILQTILSSKKSRNYFGFGLLLIFSSLFSPYRIYYIVSGTILILLAIFARFNPFFNK